MDIPLELIDLKKIQDDQREFLTGNFEINFSEVEQIADFLAISKRHLAGDFILFGRENGNIFALWNRNKESCPVVVFGSEGDRRVMAANLRSFLEILLIGYDSVVWDDILFPPKHKAEVASWFREYLEQKGIVAPANASKIFVETIGLTREFLERYCDVTLLFAQNCQFYISSRIDGVDVPTQISSEDLQRGFKSFDGGFAFYVEDRDNLEIEIIAEIVPPEQMRENLMRFPEVYSAVSEPLEIKNDGLFVWGVSAEPRKLPQQMSPGRYDLFFHVSSPGPKKPQSPIVFCMYLVPRA